jgi:peptidyl-prolyl cis-trans isomerase C
MTAMSCSLHQVAGLDRPSRIRVNGVAIEREAIAREAQNHPAEKPLAAWQEAARALVIRELLLQEARRLKVAVDPISDDEGRRETEEEALIRQVVEQEVRTPTADEAACRRYYEQNRARFRSADLFEVRHILLAAVPADGAVRATAQEQAKHLIDELCAEPSRFDQLARDFSACPSGQSGGNLGQIGPGQTVPEFERALLSAPVGEVAPQPVETRYGLHIIRVDRHIAGRELPFELVHERIRSWLDEKVQRTALAQYLSILAGRAEITGITLAAAGSPLVQ